MPQSQTRLRPANGNRGAGGASRKTAAPRATAARRRDPEGTKERLLAAAEEAFAQNGLRGARMDEIAKRAGLNKQLLYHHLGDKEDVYLAVLERVYADFRLREQSLDLEGTDPWNALDRFLSFKFDYLATHPNYVALLNDENMHRGRHVRRSRILADMHGNLVEKLAGVLRRGEAAGEFRPGIDPLQFFISLAGLCYFYFGNIHTLTVVLRRGFASPGALAERRAHIIDLVKASVRAATP